MAPAVLPLGTSRSLAVGEHDGAYQCSWPAASPESLAPGASASRSVSRCTLALGGDVLLGEIDGLAAEVDRGEGGEGALDDAGGADGNAGLGVALGDLGGQEAARAACWPPRSVRRPMV